MKLKLVDNILDVLILVAIIFNIYLCASTYTILNQHNEVTESHSSQEEVVVTPPSIDKIEILPVEDIEEYIPPVEDVQAIAKTMYGECRGVESTMEKAAVAWCILNRLDTGEYGDTVLDVVSAPSQFKGYKADHPLMYELVTIADDVMVRWHNEKEGEEDVGRVLPPEYLYFRSDSTGKHNVFRAEYDSRDYWDWSCVDVYSEIKEGN